MRARDLFLSLTCATAALVGFSLPTAASAGSRDVAASAFAVRTVRLLVEDHYAAAWPSLHPVHQRATGRRARYVRCELQAPIALDVARVEGVAVWDETAAIAGIGRVRTKAVTLEISFGLADDVATETVTHTVHVLLVRGTWRWVLPNARYEGYRRGGCP